VNEMIKNYEAAEEGLSNFLVGEVLKRKQYNIDNISLIAINIQKLLKNAGDN